MYQVSCLYLQNKCQAHFWRYGAQSAVNCATYHFHGHCACAEVISRGGSKSEIGQYGFKSVHVYMYQVSYSYLQNNCQAKNVGAMALSWQ